jgi:hypothetical protein
VQDPPLPQLVLSVSGKDMSKNISLSIKDKLLVKLVPDEAFNKALPKDSRYTIKAVNVYTVEGGVKKQAIKISGNGKDAVKGILVDLSQLKGKPGGTNLLIEVDGAYRLNFQGKAIELALPSKTIEAKLK